VTVPVKSAPEHSEQNIHVHFDVRPPELSRWRRMQIPMIAWAVYWLMRAIGPTIRFEVLGWSNMQGVYEGGKRVIATFWHRSIFSATWWWRNTGIVVMNTTNFDGQWTRRVIERLGFRTAQGSSTRGGLRALAVMAQYLEDGSDVAFTIDGPRGPRYIAKPGPVILARRTGQPIMAFHIGLERAHTFEKSWDLFQVPHLFSRAVVVFAPPVYVPPDADRELVHQKHAEMQAALDRVRDLAENWFHSSEPERQRLRDELGSLKANNHPAARGQR
jgi:lysophospholipid acyltransferase (LPLAT)-like uncharacterized protein